MFNILIINHKNFSDYSLLLYMYMSKFNIATNSSYNGRNQWTVKPVYLYSFVIRKFGFFITTCRLITNLL